MSNQKTDLSVKKENNAAPQRWQDQLRTGSWRGVAFNTESADLQGGRRVVAHEFPQRDEPFAEDLGRAVRRWSVECLVIGAGYMAQRDRLIAALEARGPGTLVHPYHGEKTVLVESFSQSESTDEGGIARFSIQFVEAGKLLSADQQADTNSAARTRAASVKGDSQKSFAKRFRVSGFPAFVEQGAAGLIQQFAGSSKFVAGLLGGASKLLRTYQDGITLLDGAISLVRSPVDLAQSVGGMISGLGAMGMLPIVRLRALVRLIDDTGSYRPVIGATPARLAEAANRQAIIRLVQEQSAAALVTTVSNMRFSSYAEAVSVRDWLANVLDDLAIDAANLGEDEAAGRFDDLRLAMVRDVTDRGASLARLRSVTPPVTSPALVIANSLFGAASIEANVADIVARNQVRHPGFVPGGQPIDVRSEGVMSNG